MEREWYAYEGGQRVGPVLEEEMKGRAASGTLRPEVLVWREGMKEWKAAGETTDWMFGAAPAGVLAVEGAGHDMAQGIPLPNSDVPVAAVLGYVQKSEEALTLSPRVLDLMVGMGRWLRFFAVLGFVMVALCLVGGIALAIAGMAGATRSADVPALGFVYLVVGVIYLFPSVYLNRSASAIGRLKRLHRTVDLEEALEGQKAFWRFCGICMIVVIAGYIVVMVAVIGAKLH